MTSTTSPHLFKDANEKDILFVGNEIRANQYCMFIRKVSPEFPDDILREYIFFKYKESDDNLIISEPFWFTYSRIKIQFQDNIYLMFIILSVWMYYLLYSHN